LFVGSTAELQKMIKGDGWRRLWGLGSISSI
jgi:hypothetical protein